jgi:hypothetical protein
LVNGCTAAKPGAFGGILISFNASFTFAFDGRLVLGLGVTVGAGLVFRGSAGAKGLTGVSVGVSEGSLMFSKTEGRPGEVLTTERGSAGAWGTSLSGTTTDLAALEKDSDSRSDDIFVVSGGKDFS